MRSGRRSTARRRSFYGRTLTEARRKAEDARGEWRPTQTGTVADFLADWLAAGRDSLKPQTWKRYETIVRRQVVPAIGDIQLAALGEKDLVRTPSRSPRQARRHDPAPRPCRARNALEEAKRRGLIQSNPARGVRPPRVKHREKVILTETDARRLLDAAKGDPMEPLYVLALTTGARVGELLALSWRDIDLEGERITIRGNAVDGYDGREIASPKTTAGHRVIPIPAVTVEMLAAFQARSGGDRASGSYSAIRPAGSSRRGSRCKRLLPLVERAGLPRMTFHSLRDTAATLMLQRGVPAHMVSRMLGHASVAITLSIYAHVTTGLEDQASAAMQGIYGDR